MPGIYDNDHDPDVVYDNSQFLFWSIVHVGSRRYAKDPTLVGTLAGPLTKFAHECLLDPDHAISSIRAAIALCLWPLPVSSTWLDPSHAIAGAALQLAIQKGLPFASRRQDFMNVPLQDAEKDRLFRSRLCIFSRASGRIAGRNERQKRADIHVSA